MPKLKNMISMTTRVVGIARGLERLDAMRNRPSGSVIAGIVEPGAAYPDGTSVALVGAVHEFGDGADIAESAWMRRANLDLAESGEIRRHLRDGMTPAAAAAVGETAVTAYRASLDAAGLRDTGLLIGSIGWKREDAPEYRDDDSALVVGGTNEP